MKELIGCRTDLAMEANEYVKRQNKTNHDGIICTKGKNYKNIDIDIIEIVSQEAANKLKKQMGKYITFSVPTIKERDLELFEKLSQSIADTMSDMLSDSDKKKGILVVGLGNKYMTADSLGPRVVEKTMVTRHIMKIMPDKVDERLRPVSAISPGVLGVTGIGTEEIVQSLNKTIKPGAIIAVDALAAHSIDRICNTIQVADTGINPGSGVGNKVKALNKESLGVPVIAIGAPTVVYASTIAQEISDIDISHSKKIKKIKDMIVTPKDIDIVIDDMATIISMALNLLIHKGITSEQINIYLN